MLALDFVRQQSSLLTFDNYDSKEDSCLWTNTTAKLTLDFGEIRQQSLLLTFDKYDNKAYS